MSKTDALVEYLKFTGSALFAVPPGVGSGEYVGTVALRLIPGASRDKIGGMTSTQPPDLVTRPTMRWAGQLAAAGFVVQAVGVLAMWLIVDDSPRRAWYTNDFQQWLQISVVMAVLLAVLGGITTKRSMATVAIGVGCLLAMLVGVALVFGYVIFNSA